MVKNEWHRRKIRRWKYTWFNNKKIEGCYGEKKYIWQTKKKNNIKHVFIEKLARESSRTPQAIAFGLKLGYN